MSSKQSVVIVGAGIYGMSTALWMLKDGGYEVTIVDRCETLPAMDAASTDLNKIIRAGDYADPALAKMAIEAVDHWRLPEWEGTYHESGVTVLASSSDPYGHKFVTSAYKNLCANNIPALLTPNAEALKALLPTNIPVGPMDGREGYANPVGGWAEAARATEVGLKRVEKMGGKVRGGCEVVGLEKNGRRVEGVKLKSGEVVKGDLVLIAAGAWTPSLCASSDVNISLPPIEATGQSIATIQLNPEEIERYSKIPVYLNLDNGFYVFPPNPEGLVKVAIHNAGYTNPSTRHDGAIDGQGEGEGKKVSVPRTKLTPGAQDGFIPKAMIEELRVGLRDIFPELAAKDFEGTRLCWYCDTVTGDWLIDYHPDFDNLVVASGDSGHGFKYAPIIGREILKVVQKNPSPEYALRWSFKGDAAAGADNRRGVRQDLVLDELASVADLKA